MENNNKKNNISSIIIVFLALVIIILSFIVYKLKIDNKKLENNNINVNINETSDEEFPISNDINNMNLKINELTIDNVEIKPNGVNTHINITGIINLSFNEEEIEGVSISGYCIGKNDEKYIISGPSDGRALFHSGSSNLSLSESKILNSNGEEESINSVDWNKVIIESCNLDKLKVSGKTSINIIEKDINYEKIISNKEN